VHVTGLHARALAASSIHEAGSRRSSWVTIIVFVLQRCGVTRVFAFIAASMVVVALTEPSGRLG